MFTLLLVWGYVYMNDIKPHFAIQILLHLKDDFSSMQFISVFDFGKMLFHRLCILLFYV